MQDGKASYQLEQSGRLPGGGGNRVEPVRISLGEGERGVQVQGIGKGWPLLLVGKQWGTEQEV